MKVDGRDLRAVWWEGDEAHGRVVMVDQRLLPHEVTTVDATTVEEVAAHIRAMTVRGAPTIGATAAYGMVLGRHDPEASAKVLAAARPTARDLFTALEWMQAGEGPALARAEAYVADILDRCRRIGRHGRALLADMARDVGHARVLTHCHAGALATVDHGTALAPLHAVVEAPLADDVRPFVWVDETRPRAQGAITAWELAAAGIDHKVLVDNAAGALMARGDVDVVITGADRIAANGDVANKIGTYTKAVLAQAHGIPFYVAAPRTTFDASCPDGAAIQIEERDPEEVLSFGGRPVYGAGTVAVNPAFDVTPARMVTAYITENGVLSRDGLEHYLRETGTPLDSV